MTSDVTVLRWRGVHPVFVAVEHPCTRPDLEVSFFFSSTSSSRLKGMSSPPLLTFVRRFPSMPRARHSCLPQPSPPTSPPPEHSAPSRSTPTNDDIEAVIKLATSSLPSIDRPLRDTRTQLFVGNVRDPSPSNLPTPSIPFSSPIASAGKTSRISFAVPEPSFVQMSPSGQIIARVATAPSSLPPQRMPVVQLTCLTVIAGKRESLKSVQTD